MGVGGGCLCELDKKLDRQRLAGGRGSEKQKRLRIDFTAQNDEDPLLLIKTTLPPPPPPPPLMNVLKEHSKFLPWWD